MSVTAEIADPLETLDKGEDKPRDMPAPGEQIDLDRDERCKLGRRLKALWMEAVAARPEDTRDDAGNATDPGLAFDWREYNVRLPMDPKTFPLRGPNGEALSANFLIPIVHTTCNALMAQWMSPVYDNNPLFQAEPPTDADKDKAERAERYLDYLCDHGMRFRESDRKCVERMAVEGVGIKYWRWETPPRRRWDRKANAMVETSDGRETPVCEVIPRDRFHLWPVTASDVDKAEFVFVRRDMTLHELEAGADDGSLVIDDEDLETLRGGRLATDQPAKPEQADIDEVNPRRYEAVDVYGVYDGDGERTDCLFTFVVGIDPVISAMPSKLGATRPFTLHYAYDHGDDFMGKSVPQMIRGVNAALHQFILQAANGATLEHLLNQTGVVEADADFEIVLGRLDNPVRSANGFRFINFHPGQTNMAMIELFQDQLERATGLNANILGAYAPSSTTATQTRAAMGAGSLQFQQSVRLRNEALKRDAYILSEVIYAYAPDTIDFATPATDAEVEEARAKHREEQAHLEQIVTQVIGVPESDIIRDSKPNLPSLITRKVKATDFERVDWNVAGSVPGLDKQSKVQEAMALLQTLAPAQQDHPERMWEFANNLLQAMKVDNVERFIGEKPEPEDPADPKKPTPEEVALLMGGDPGMDGGSVGPGGVPADPTMMQGVPVG